MIESTPGEEFYGYYIPDSILTEILIRLPLKSIFLFKTVSKHWLSLISDPFFARYYVTRINNDSSSHQPWILLFTVPSYQPRRVQDPTSFSPAGFSQLSSSVLSLSFLPFHLLSGFFRILASSKDLVLCFNKGCPSTYCVCNPLTKQYVILPKPRKHTIYVDAGIICQDDGSYTVVRIPRHVSSSKIFELEIFSSETGTWRQLNFFCPDHNYSLGYELFCSTISYNGILHWSAEKQIFAYDPYRSTDQCYTIDLPKGTENLLTYKLTICCGRLCCLAVDDHLTVWELTDYESRKWHLKHISKCIDICSIDAGLHEYFPNHKLINFDPLAMHPFDWDTVYGLCAKLGNWRSASYHFQTRTYEVVDNGSIHATLHPLVLEPWPTLIPRPSGALINN